MKKHFYSKIVMLLLISAFTCGCGKEEAESVVHPDTVITETPASSEETVIPETTYPYWWELHDYNLEQELLSSDGEIKNLTLQPGNNPDELYVTWFSKSDSRGKVKFQAKGLKGDITAKATTEPSIAVAGYYRNSALIKNLNSNTTYTYYVKNGSTTSPTYTYTTSDLKSTDFTFTIAGDPEIGLGDPEVLPGHRSIWRVVLNRMKSQIPESEFILTMGDQIADPASSIHYDYFLDNSVLYSTPLVPVMGNHDVGTGFFGDHFSLPNLSNIGTSEGRDGNYWFRKGNALFMVLNNLSPTHSDDHERFVGETIAQNRDVKWKVIISHYSPVSMVERYQGAAESIRASYAYMDELYDIDLFLGGHDHLYTRSFFIDQNRTPISTEFANEFHNPEHPIYVIFNSATNVLLRHPDQDYPWSAISVQNDIPQLSRVHVTDYSFTITTYDADSWSIVDNFTIYKD